MKPKTVATLFASACILMAVPALAGTSINIGIGVPASPPVVVVAPPAVVIPAPPAVVLIPGTPVYYAPGLSVEIFFHQGWWWMPHRGHWYRSRCYGGPWTGVMASRVPGAFRHLPRDYRRMAARERRIPYSRLDRHWRDGQGEHHNYRPDNDRHDDYRHDRHEYRGRGEDRRSGPHFGGGHGR
ncbi:MAG: hypothetical protein V2A77_06050 [Pseudomonadota bacterium]